MISFLWRKMILSTLRSRKRKPASIKPITRRMRGRTLLDLESLESRLNPAILSGSGTVLTLTLSPTDTGATITGSASDLMISTGSSDTITVTGTAAGDGLTNGYDFQPASTNSVSAAIDGSGFTAATQINVVGATGANLTLDLDGPLVSNASVGIAFTADSATPTIIASSVDTGTAAQNYAGGVTLGASVDLSGSTITLAAVTAGGNSLTTTDSTNTQFNGNVSGVNNLLVTGSSTINTSSLTSFGIEQFTGAVKLDTDTTLSGDNIDFGSTVDAATAGGESLSINAGSVAFSGAIGSLQPLNELNVTTTGSQDIDQDIDADSVDFQSDVAGDGGNDIVFESGITIDADSQTYQAGNGTFNNTSFVDFSGASTGTFSDTAGLGNPLSFTYEQDSGISDSEPTASQYTNSDLSGMDLTLSSPTSVGLSASAANVEGTNLTLLSPGMNGGVFLQTSLTLNSLVANSPNGISPTNDAVITTTVGGQTYTGPIILTTNTTFDAAPAGTNGTITIVSGVTNNNGLPSLTVLTVDSGSASSSISGGITDQDSNDPTGLDITGGTVTLFGTNSYSGPTTIGIGAVLVAGAADVLSPDSAVNDSGTLDLASFAEQITNFIGTGTIVNTGGGSSLLDITGTANFGGTVTAGALTVGGTTAITTTSITTTGAQDYEGDVTLGVDPGTTVDLITSGSTVTFGGDLTLGATPTTATDTLDITGELVLSPATTLTSTFAGTGASQFGHVTASSTNYGNATLALNYSSFTPVFDDSFDVVSNDSASTGQFANVTAPGPVDLNGTSYAVTYTGASGNDLILSAAGAPTANAQSVTVAEDATDFPITLTGSDPNTPPLSLTYTVTVEPAHGTLSGTGPNLAYTPDAGYFGPDSFQFTDSNGAATSTAATVSITVVGTPTANSQTVSMDEDATSVPVTLTGTDPNSPPLSLTYTVTMSPTHGTLSGTGPNLTYTPAAGFFGTDSFQFTVTNGTATSTAATVTLNVVGPPDTTILTGPAAFSPSSSATFTFSGSNTVDPGALTFQSSLDGAPFTTATTPLTLTGLADGSHTLLVRSVNEFGAVDPTPASFTWTVDTIAPTVSISAPSVLIATPGSTVTYTVGYSDVNFASSTLSDANVHLIATGTATGTLNFDAGSGPVRTVTITDIQGDGSLAISIDAGSGTDLAGNTTLAAGPSESFQVRSNASVSIANGPGGLVTLVTRPDGTLIQYDSTGAHLLGTGVLSASIAFGPQGAVYMVTHTDGSLYEYNSTGNHLLSSSGVLSASIAFGPSGAVILITRSDFSLTEYDSAGAQLLGGGVLNASIAFGPSGAVILITRTDLSLTEYDSTGVHLLGSGVLSASIAFTPSTVVDEIYSNGGLYEFDASGSHYLGQVF